MQRPEDNSDAVWQQPGDAEVFRGETLAAAVAAATAAYGPDVQVKAARSIRQGLRGLVGKEYVEVLAERGPFGAAAHATSQAVASAQGPTNVAPATVDLTGGVDATIDELLRRANDSDTADFGAVLAQASAAASQTVTQASLSAGSDVAAFTALVQQALQRVPETDLVVTHQPPAQRTHEVVEDAEIVDADPSEEPAHTTHSAITRRAITHAAEAAAREAAKPVTATPKTTRARVAPSPRPRAGRTAAAAAPAVELTVAVPKPPTKVAAKAAPKARPRKASAGASGWSLDSLAAVGVPEEVLAAMPGVQPADDLAWVIALTTAISSVVPAPAEPGAASPVVMTAYGEEGALGLLRGGVAGLTPGTLTLGDRCVQATATELALVVRSMVLR